MSGHDSSGKVDQTGKVNLDFDFKTLAAAATVFAFAFNVGYFSAIDISLFTLFNVSEHVVFAIRALPVAVGLLVLFGIILSLPALEEVDGSLKTIIRIGYMLLILCWAISLLVVGAVTWWRYSHFGLGFSFMAVGFGTLWYHFVGRYIDSQAPVLLYWVSTAIFVAFFIGHYAGWTIVNSDRYSVIKVGNSPIVGTLILSSSQNALLYEVDPSVVKNSMCLGNLGVTNAPERQMVGIIRVVPWKDIADIRLCP
jgi:hypothetical protein